MRLQCCARAWRARRTVAHAQQERLLQRHEAAAAKVQEWWRGERRRRDAQEERRLRARARDFQRQMQLEIQRAQERERALVAATYAMIAVVKRRWASVKYAEQWRSALLLECAWRGCKARDVSIRGDGYAVFD